MTIFMDSYQLLFDNLVSKDELFEFGLKHSIFIDKDTAHQEWERLKKSITDNQEVHIRGYGRNGHGTSLFLGLYRDVFGNHQVKQDATNNASPKRMLQNLSGYRVNQNLFNFQIAHIFGRTKNPYSFTTPWNLAFIPKIIDPFTGHEARGDYVQEYQKLFTDRAFDLFEDFIGEFNEIVTSDQLQEKFHVYFKHLDSYSEIEPEKLNRFKTDVYREFEPITRLDSPDLNREAQTSEPPEGQESIENIPSLKQRVKTWLQIKGIGNIEFKASKLNDRNNKYDWWFTFNLDRHLHDAGGTSSILCEKEPSSPDFFYFVLPNQLITQHGHTRTNQMEIDLWICQADNNFKIRNSNCELKNYLINVS